MFFFTEKDAQPVAENTFQKAIELSPALYSQGGVTYGVDRAGITQPGIVHFLHIGGSAAIGKRLRSCRVVGAHSGSGACLDQLKEKGNIEKQLIS